MDADAQAHATLYLLGQKAEPIEPDLSHILDGYGLADITVRVQPEGFALVPSSLRVAEMDMRLVADTGRRDQRLRRALQRVDSEYDLVIIDCPPALSLVTVNALAAADGILCPVTMQNFALHGLQRFLRWVERFREEEIVRAELIGVLPTQYAGRQSADREGLIALHNSGLPLLEPVPRRTGVERVVAGRMAGGDVREFPEPAVAAAYSAAADRIATAAHPAPAEVAAT